MRGCSLADISGTVVAVSSVIYRSSDFLVSLTMYSAFLLAAILSVVGQVLSLPGGAPLDACSALVPGHNGRRGSNATNAVDPPGGFYIYTELLDDNNYGNYTAGTMYKGNQLLFS